MPEGASGDPPGRLVPALPMGTSVLVGRFAEPGFLAAGSGPAPREAWVRALEL
jgi:hypothetical protein